MRDFRIRERIKYYNKVYKIKKEIEEMFIEGGYTYIELPVFENPNDIGSLYKTISKESMVKVLDGNSNVLILRADNTANIIKNFIPIWDKGIKLKLFYNSIVFRNRPSQGIKEIQQLGVEYLGESALVADKKIIELALNILNKFNSGFILEISNSKYIHGLLKDIETTYENKQLLKELLYRKNRFDLKNFIEKLGIHRDIYECLLNMIDFQGEIFETIERAKIYYINDIMREALDELLKVGEFIDRLEYSKYIYADLSMIMELGYYDGMIFQGYYPNSFNKIIHGGRYDSFTEEFGLKVPAIGFSLDVDEIIENYLKNGVD